MKMLVAILFVASEQLQMNYSIIESEQIDITLWRSSFKMED